LRRNGCTVAPSSSTQVPEAVAQVVAGDPLALSLIAPLQHDEFRAAVTGLNAPLVVSRVAAVLVLHGLSERIFSPEQVQAWASFVRRGYVANPVGRPIRPIDIAYEDAWEEAIAATVSRLDEIGDLVDGEVMKGEIADLLQLLGEP
jgi:hypothetical protein